MIAREAAERVKELDKELTAYDFQWNHWVHVHHEDGSSMQLNYAFYKEEGDWIFVFSEHNGYHFFHKDEVEVHAYNLDK